MRFTALIACIALAAPVSAARQPLDTLTPAQAISRAAAASPKPVRALFQFKVENAAKMSSGYYLDSEKNFRSASNLGVWIRASAMPGLIKKYGADLRAALVGKTVKIIGQVRRVAVGKNGARILRAGAAMMNVVAAASDRADATVLAGQRVRRETAGGEDRRGGHARNDEPQASRHAVHDGRF